MKTLAFREWFAKNPEELYGIDPEHNLSLEEKRRKRAENYDEPGNILSPTRLMSELMRMGPVNNKAPQRVWSDVVAYGDAERSGSLMASLTPSGSLRFNIRRLCVDLEGTRTWVLKKVISLVEQIEQKERGDTAEHGMAQEYHEVIEKIDGPHLDAAKNDFKGMEELALRLASMTRQNHPTVMHYAGIRKHDENYYQIYFQYRGHGAGGDTPRQAVMEQFDINFKYYKERGVIRCWGGEIQSPKKGHRWKLMPSEWDEYFVPTQSVTEITESIIHIFLAY